jgi:carbon-monoxide dehydrogenase large subunit
MGQFGVGQPVPRTEDNRFVIGAGAYTDDAAERDQAHAYMVRSPFAHAAVKSIDVSEAISAPSVLAVYTGKDIEKAGLGPIPCLVGGMLPNRDGTPMFTPNRKILQDEFVRYAGDSVAMIVAESVNAAKDAADLVLVDYEEKPVLWDLEKSASPDAPKIYDEAKSNVCFDWEFGDEAGANSAFKKAANTVNLKLINNRMVVNSMEPRAASATYDPATDQYTLTVGSQGVQLMRMQLANMILNIPEENLRVVTRDVGGGFGMKTFMFPEYPLVLWAAKNLGRPVKWTGERSDAFLTDTQGRDQVTNAALALDANGKILALRMETFGGVGAYCSTYGPAIPTAAAIGMHTGVYDIPVQYNHVQCVLTNTTPIDAYRGAGRPEASYIIERLVDRAADELGLRRDEIRRRNFIGPEKMPFESPNGVNFDSGEFEANLDQSMKAADWSGFETRKAVAKANGKLAGIGMSYYVERTAGSDIEHARIEINDDKTITLWVGTQSTGQGHETAFAQIVSEKLGVDFECIEVKSGDTAMLEKGTGTGGSRSLYMGGGAATVASDDALEKGKEIAANELEAAAADIVYADGKFSIAGTDRSIGLFDVAAISTAKTQTKGVTGLTGDGDYNQDVHTYPNGCHICEVEVDPNTGASKVVRYTIVDDYGKVMNPLLLAGQVHGGVIAGLGQAMGEHAVYDDTGQLITGSYMDYWMPRADDFPELDFAYNEVPCTTNPMGVKGCGEAGTVGALGAYGNAMADALKELGIAHIDMPVTPQKLWSTIHNR